MMPFKKGFAQQVFWIVVLEACVCRATLRERVFELPPGRYDPVCVFDAEIKYLIKPYVDKKYPIIPDSAVDDFSRGFRDKMDTLGLLNEKAELLLLIAQKSDRIEPEDFETFEDVVNTECQNDAATLMFLPYGGAVEGDGNQDASFIISTLLSTDSSSRKIVNSLTKGPEKVSNFVEPVVDTREPTALPPPTAAPMKVLFSGVPAESAPAPLPRRKHLHLRREHEAPVKGFLQKAPTKSPLFVIFATPRPPGKKTEAALTAGKAND